MDVMPGSGPVAGRQAQDSYHNHLVGLTSRSNEPVRVREVPSLLLKERIIFMPPFINDQVSTLMVGMLLYLESEDAHKDINLYIDCLGSVDGHLYFGLAIYDTIQTIKPDVATVCIGMAQGIAAAIMAGGTKGKRYCLPHASIILHEPHSRARGQASDIDIMARELLRERNSFYDILSRHTGQNVERIKQDASRMNYMTPRQALDYGLIDEILEPEESDTTGSAEK
jgi:ATP-dependent Clp protease protease subunit